LRGLGPPFLLPLGSQVTREAPGDRF